MGHTSSGTQHDIATHPGRGHGDVLRSLARLFHEGFLINLDGRADGGIVSFGLRYV